MFTDIVDFTSRTQESEADALKMLEEQEGLVRPLLAAHRGREVKSTGDGFLIEFDSALRAVQCAIAIHDRMLERNARSPGPAIRLRIGVHLGDVEERDGDIFGDAVNIASRIEAFASPGGLCISGPVFEQVRNKIAQPMQPLGPQSLKHVRFPVDLYRVELAGTVAGPATEDSTTARLAVLPFASIGPDRRDEYLAEGLTEELISVLSQLRGLRVIARTSVKQYRATTKPVSQIGAELGVSSLLEGSVRKDGDQLRISVQLIRVDSQEPVWARTYDRKLDSVFAVQADIARLVAQRLKVRVRSAERARLETRPRVRPESYLAYLKGRSILNQIVSRESLERAKGEFERAIALDSTNAPAHSGLADAIRQVGWYYEGSSATPGEEARRWTTRALELDPNLAEAHASLGLLYWDDLDYGGAEREFRVALALTPSYSQGRFWYAVLLEDLGRADEALEELTLAEGSDPLSSKTLFQLSCLLIWLGRLDEALAKIQRLGELEPSGRGYFNALARYHLARGDLPECLRAVERMESAAEEPRVRSALHALYLTLSGDAAAAKALLRQEAELPEFPPAQWILGWVCAELGDRDECFRWLERALRNRNLPFQQFRLDPRLAPVRADPQFRTLLAAMKLAA
jgi:adenylate cyclase